MREELSQAGHDAGRLGQEPIETREDLIGWFQLLLNEATAILTLAKRRGDSRLALQAHKAAIESLLQIGKTKGFITPDGQTFIDARQQANLAALPPAAWRALLRMAEAGDSPTITVDIDELGGATQPATAENATDNRKLPVLSETEVVRATG